LPCPSLEGVLPERKAIKDQKHTKNNLVSIIEG